jgi:hypothetical protein
MSDINYYISFVVATRNDDHGENMFYKNQYFIDRWAYLVKKFNLSSELIIVEWNPPEDRPKLVNQLKIPNLGNNQKIKFITIPNSVHKKFKNSEKLNFFQMIAKNVGIRKAEGKFILCTNIDIIFSDEIIEFLSKKELKLNTIYRTDRYDIDFDDFQNIKIDTNKLKSDLTFIHKSDFTIDIKNKKKYYTKLGWKYLFEKIYESLIKKNQKIQDDQKRIERKKFFEKLKYVYNYIYNMYFKNLHTNACGDFTLCSKEIWIKCGGYYEFEGYSFHIDSLFLWSGYLQKFNFNFLNFKIFHINHTIGSGFSYGNTELETRLNKSKIPFIENYEIPNYIKLMKEKKIINSEDWGQHYD